MSRHTELGGTKLLCSNILPSDPLPLPDHLNSRTIVSTHQSTHLLLPDTAYQAIGILLASNVHGAESPYESLWL